MGNKSKCDERGGRQIKIGGETKRLEILAIPGVNILLGLVIIYHNDGQFPGSNVVRKTVQLKLNLNFK